MSSHKTFRIKRKLAKCQKMNRPVPQWVRMKTGNRIRYNAKRRHWRRTKLKLWSCFVLVFQHVYACCDFVEEIRNKMIWNVVSFFVNVDGERLISIFHSYYATVSINIDTTPESKFSAEILYEVWTIMDI